jgi:hypothetical protein
MDLSGHGLRLIMVASRYGFGDLDHLVRECLPLGCLRHVHAEVP